MKDFQIVAIYELYDKYGEFLKTMEVGCDFDILDYIRFHNPTWNFREILASQKHDLTENPSGNKL